MMTKIQKTILEFVSLQNELISLLEAELPASNCEVTAAKVTLAAAKSGLTSPAELRWPVIWPDPWPDLWPDE